MKSLERVREDFAAGNVELSIHALRRLVERNIRDTELCEAGSRAEFIEHYPHDKYSPSALLLGFTKLGRALHFQVSLRETLTTKVVTVYEPDSNEWADFKFRR